MSILSGFKRYKDYVLTDGGYILTSRWTKSNSVEMDDGTTLEEKVTELKNSITSAGVSTVKYDKSVDDFLYVMDEGEWKPTSLKAGLARLDLFKANNNLAGFSVYGGSSVGGGITTDTTFSLGETLYFKVNASGQSVRGSSILSELQTIGSYKKLILNYTIKVDNRSAYDMGILFITEFKNTSMIPIASDTFFQGTVDNISTKTGTVELDISSLKGQYYIGVELRSNNTWTEITITNAYME